MVVPGPGIESEPQLPPIPQRGNTGSFKPVHQVGDQTHTSALTQATSVRFLSPCATVGIKMTVNLMEHLESLWKIV